MHFGAALRLIRLDSGISLRDLARRLNVSSAYLSRVENGLDAVPTPFRLGAMARELGVSPTALIALAQRINPLVADYIERVPEAGSLFLEVAYRDMSAAQLAELRSLVVQRQPAASEPDGGALAAIVRPESVVLGLIGSDMDDVLDLAAGRLAEVSGRADAVRLGAALREREVVNSSAIGGGIAVPRVYIEGAAPAAALIVLGDGLIHDTPDGRPLRVVIALMGPRADPGRRAILVQIARLASQGLADRLAGADSVAAVMRCLA